MNSETERPSQIAERRSALRQKCRVKSLVVEHAVAGLISATVLDLSREGFRLLLPASLPCGDEVLVHPPTGAGLLKIRGTIVRQSIAVHDGVRMIECGVEVGDTAAWRKHGWFIALRAPSPEAAAALPNAVKVEAA